MRSVLVVVPRQIGDVLLATPLVRRARTLWPQAAIDVLGFEGTLGMLEGNPDVRALIEVPAKGRAWEIARRVWRRYDLALIADPGDRAHLIGMIAARARIGILPAQHASNWWKRGLLRHAIVAGGDLGDVHVVAEKLRLLEPWNASAPEGARLVAPTAAPLPPALVRQLRNGYVVMHTPSMWPYKQWPIAHFRELAARLAQAGRQVVLTGGPGKNDRDCVTAMAGAAPPPDLVDAGVLGFNQLVTLLQGAALYIGPDTSVSHLAAATGVRVLAIFGPTNPLRWSPWPDLPDRQPMRFVRRADSQTAGRVTLLQSDLPCVPCGKAGCDDHRMSRADCLPSITPDRVAREALALLAAS